MRKRLKMATICYMVNIWAAFIFKFRVLMKREGQCQFLGTTRMARLPFPGAVGGMGGGQCRARPFLATYPELMALWISPTYIYIYILLYSFREILKCCVTWWHHFRLCSQKWCCGIVWCHFTKFLTLPSLLGVTTLPTTLQILLHGP